MPLPVSLNPRRYFQDVAVGGLHVPDTLPSDIAQRTLILVTTGVSLPPADSKSDPKFNLIQQVSTVA